MIRRKHTCLDENGPPPGVVLDEERRDWPDDDSTDSGARDRDAGGQGSPLLEVEACCDDRGDVNHSKAYP